MSRALENKIALVTGVTSGIGQAVCEALCERGVQVLGVGRNQARLEELSARLGQRFVPCPADLSVPKDREALFEQIRSHTSELHVLINNAAEVVYATPTHLSAIQWARLFEINLVAGAELVRVLSGSMRPGAHVINVSSATARHLPNARFAPYAATKIALESLTQALRLELDPKGIKVSLVAPGLVDTPAYDKVEGFDKAKQKLLEQVPQWLEPADVAEAISWMLDRPAHVVVSELVLLPRGQAR